jgi:hypothetical protein
MGEKKKVCRSLAGDRHTTDGRSARHYPHSANHIIPFIAHQSKLHAAFAPSTVPWTVCGGKARISQRRISCDQLGQSKVGHAHPEGCRGGRSGGTASARLGYMIPNPCTGIAPAPCRALEWPMDGAAQVSGWYMPAHCHLEVLHGC